MAAKQPRRLLDGDHEVREVKAEFRKGSSRQLLTGYSGTRDTHALGVAARPDLRTAPPSRGTRKRDQTPILRLAFRAPDDE